MAVTSWPRGDGETVRRPGTCTVAVEPVADVSRDADGVIDDRPVGEAVGVRPSDRSAITNAPTRANAATTPPVVTTVR